MIRRQYFREIPDFLSGEECSRIINFLDGSCHWEEAMVINPDGSIMPSENRQQLALRDEKANNDEKALGQSLCDRIRAEIEEVKGRGDPVIWQFQKNREGDYFGWHEDSSAARPSNVTCLLYLSDGNTHVLEGGATEIKQGSKSVLIEPEAGKLVVFCAKNMHRGRRVDKGLKYAFVSCFN